MTHLERTIDFMKDLDYVMNDIKSGLADEGADIVLIKDTLAIYKRYIKTKRREINQYKKMLHSVEDTLNQSLSKDDYNFYLNVANSYKESIKIRSDKIENYTKFCTFLKSSVNNFCFV